MEKYLSFSTILQSGEEGTLLTFFLHIYILIDLHSGQIILKKYFLKNPKDYRFLQAQGRIPYVKLQNIKIYLFYNGSILYFIFMMIIT